MIELTVEEGKLIRSSLYSIQELIKYSKEYPTDIEFMKDLSCIDNDINDAYIIINSVLTSNGIEEIKTFMENLP